MSDPVPNTGTDREVLITRTFTAPRTLVFRTWTTADHLQRWYAPPGCELSACSVDFRIGGSLRFCIRIPDGTECWCRGIYREIVPDQRIVFTMENTDAQGVPLTQDATTKDPEWPVSTVVTVTFADDAGGTRLTLHQNVSERVAKRTGAHPSWLAMFDRLVILLNTPSAH